MFFFTIPNVRKNAASRFDLRLCLHHFVGYVTILVSNATHI